MPEAPLGLAVGGVDTHEPFARHGLGSEHPRAVLDNRVVSHMDDDVVMFACDVHFHELQSSESYEVEQGDNRLLGRPSTLGLEAHVLDHFFCSVPASLVAKLVDESLPEPLADGLEVEGQGPGGKQGPVHPVKELDAALFRGKGVAQYQLLEDPDQSHMPPVHTRGSSLYMFLSGMA